ncbi:hypothetical protein [Nitrincola sp. A-D6]|uniref:hypothetical protein n=1 Tax=Nitrincola sp. A-D6 TaxID=1545442 RepID=UPI000AC197B3|nr:hypothetical protein [Nitrincola sp. A-D6]
MTSEFQQHAVSLASGQPFPAWLGQVREQGGQLWQDLPWPTRKTEAWRYTSLLPIENAQWQLASQAKLDSTDG